MRENTTKILHTRIITEKLKERESETERKISKQFGQVMQVKKSETTHRNLSALTSTTKLL